MKLQTRRSLLTTSVIPLVGAVLFGISNGAPAWGQRNLDQVDAVARTSSYIKERFDAAAKLRKGGDLRAAEAAYESMLADRLTSSFPSVRLGYANLLESEGKIADAMKVVKPLIFTRGGSSDFRAVRIFERDLGKTQGLAAVRAFRNQIHDKSLDGLSLKDYNKSGLSDDQAMLFIQGSILEAKGDFVGALTLYKKIVPEYPPSDNFFHHVRGALNRLHRNKEVTPLFEAWYIHSSPEMRETMKQHYNLNYKRLDAQGHP